MQSLEFKIKVINGGTTATNFNLNPNNKRIVIL